MSVKQMRNERGETRMRINLIGEMAKRRVTTNALAELLGCHRNSIHNKLYGITEFTLSEALLIFKTYFADCDFLYLFEPAEAA